MSKIFYPSVGLQRYDVPDGINMIFVDVVGSAGNSGGSTAGFGGRVQCYVNVTNLRTLYIMVGNVPANSMTAEYNASDIRTVNDINDMSSRIVVAGGGGSGADNRGYGDYERTVVSGGGSAGGEEGFGTDNAVHGRAVSYGATGGTQLSGGSAGAGTQGGLSGQNGSFGLGGNGNNGNGWILSGAGGAGWYGGGSGGTSVAKYDGKRHKSASGGAGGSSYANPTYCLGVINQAGANETSGYVEISEIQQSKDNSPRLYNGNKEIITVSSSSENIVKIYKGSTLIWDVYRLFLETTVPSSYSVVVPKGKYRFTLVGGGGGSSNGGASAAGAYWQGTLAISENNTKIDVVVGKGGAGCNAYARNNNGFAGSSSSIKMNNFDLTCRGGEQSYASRGANRAGYSFAPELTTTLDVTTIGQSYYKYAGWGDWGSWISGTTYGQGAPSVGEKSAGRSGYSGYVKIERIA